ncbi:hypothetical protein P5673_004069 [Acropora cervicornis]|uniref:Uncharacterized protein n=1 Tax=Acropora cervicornis TaxID=6130 RepID=A0AAD9R1M5_ACRCE|nr:hypothetical protein P5673_004069 [Acropora cervicornis]
MEGAYSVDREYKPTKTSVMKSGCAIKPTIRSVDARPQSNRLDGERRDGVFHTPYSTNAFPVTATNASENAADLFWIHSRP